MGDILLGSGVAWLNNAAHDELVRMQDASPKRLEQLSGIAWGRSAGASLTLHNEAFLASFLLEQLNVPKTGGERLRRVLERDFEGVDGFHRAWSATAADGEVEWIVFALSFLDFRFGIFPLRGCLAPFCTSPVFCWCVHPAVIRHSGMSRDAFLAAQWQSTGWALAESRLACFEQPLDLFSEPQSCASGLC